MQVKTIVAGAALALVGVGLLVNKALKNNVEAIKRRQFESRLASVNLPGNWSIEKVDGRWAVEYSTATESYVSHFDDANDVEMDKWVSMLVLKHQTNVVDAVIDAAVSEYIDFKKTTEPSLWGDVEVAPAGENKVVLTKGEKSTTVDISSFKRLDVAVRELSKE